MWAKTALLAFLLFLILAFLAACPESPKDSSTADMAALTAGETPPAGPAEQQDTAAGTSTAIPMEDAVVKQLIIMYSGDTLSIPDANFDYNPPEGGLPALAEAITSYQARIVEYNRLRVESEGGDAGSIRADYNAGMLGEHPFMLFDYGGWSRPNDPAGAPFVSLYARMFNYLHYTAVGCATYLRLPEDRWESYAASGIELPLVVSTGEVRPCAIPGTACAMREIHGDQWCTVAVPLPLIEDDPFVRIEEYVDAAAEIVGQQGADYSILLMAGGPDSTYERLADEGPFSVVIGGTRGESVPQGYGDMPNGGSLILPAIDPGGREIGICHIFYPGESEKPLKYNFIRKRCYEEPRQPYPFRKQVAEAKKEHDELYKQLEPLLKSPVDE